MAKSGLLLFLGAHKCLLLGVVYDYYCQSYINQQSTINKQLKITFFLNMQTFDKSSPPARFGIVGIAIGLATFSFITVAICMLWFCCLRGKSEYKEQEGDGDEEEEDEKRSRQKRKVSPMEVKPHGLKYIA